VFGRDGCRQALVRRILPNTMKCEIATKLPSYSAKCPSLPPSNLSDFLFLPHRRCRPFCLFPPSLFTVSFEICAPPLTPPPRYFRHLEGSTFELRKPPVPCPFHLSGGRERGWRWGGGGGGSAWYSPKNSTHHHTPGYLYVHRC
jgi:hypothetical protein